MFIKFKILSVAQEPTSEVSVLGVLEISEMSKLLQF